jgi:hypothetical protein
MNPRLQRILRDVERRKPPAQEARPATDLGAAIDALVEQAVRERIDEHLERQGQPTSPRLRQLMRDFNAPVPKTDFSQVPEPPKAAPPKDLTALIHRDGEGRAAWVEVGGMKLDVQRDSLGRVLRLVPSDAVPVLPPPPIPELASAREYQDGEPR